LQFKKITVEIWMSKLESGQSFIEKEQNALEAHKVKNTEGLRNG